MMGKTTLGSANASQQVVIHNYEKDCENNIPAKAAPAGNQPVGDGQPPRKPQRRQGDAEDGQAAGAQADHEALGKEEVPISAAQALQDGANHNQSRAGGEQVPEVARVVDGADDEAREDHEKRLQRANDGDLEGRVAGERADLVDGLERAIACDEAWMPRV
jgi:hypothetical protein